MCQFHFRVPSVFRLLFFQFYYIRYTKITPVIFYTRRFNNQDYPLQRGR